MGDSENSKQEVSPPEIVRIRRSEVIGVITLVPAVALIGLLWNYTHTNQQTLDAKIQAVRDECHEVVREAKTDLRRELDRCCRGVK